ncbi:alpha/beta hydrolase [Streptomyces longispororuber]|uniref:alpha/beta hydrolase n=1 Tax=Streptomyces longispororuber TaxID=68230 RepID=UPI00210C87BA|nr:alpha/beta hydrolase [Streptomyces longispororuber]MCQ4212714.1 alpha/beta hydrolase family protein [Streptomyces longispororuber]
MGSRPGRVRRALLALFVTGAVVVPVSAAAHPDVPAPAPARLGTVTAATLERAYERNRATAARAADMADAAGFLGRARALRAIATPDRTFLTFDARGAGRTAEVLGDLAHADRIAVLVPGSDTSLDTYGRFRAGALALHDRLGARAAVVAWLGYETPATIGPAVTTTGRAESAAPALTAFVRTLRTVAPGSSVTLLCHSYGSVVCAGAAPGLTGRAAICDLVLLGSPGTGADTAAALGTRATVWAARGADDWIAGVPHTKADVLGTTVGFGTDPVSGSFGARVFAAGGGGHSDYFRTGSPSLANITRIVLGQDAEVTHV